MKYPFHKDRVPGETISLIKSILTGIGFSFSESWHIFSDGCYSVRITDQRIPYLGTNGKGTTRENALASAYAEFMERLQNRYLVKAHFGLINISEPDYPDQEKIGIDELLKQVDFPILFENLRDAGFKEMLKERVQSLDCVPFYHVNEKKVVYLPLDLITSYCFSNGLCAGNTPEEAIVHGICEIFEGYAVRQVYDNGLRLPTIPLDRIMQSKVAPLVEDFIRKGYGLIVKDCTFDGSFPVLGIVVFDKNRRRYKVKIDSNPVFEVALIRCLNEIVQGCNAENFKGSLLPVQWNINDEDENNSKEYGNGKEFIQFLINGRGQYNDSIFYAPGPPSMGDVFVDTFTTQKDLLKHVVNLIRRKGYSIYVRDVSFLGFPAYRVYIPGMSELLSLSSEEAWFVMCDAPVFRKVLLRLKQASPGELKKLAYYMEYSFTRPSQRPAEYYGSITDIFMEKTSDLTSLPPRSLLVLIYLRLQDYKKAFEHLNQCMVEENPDDLEVSNGIKNETLKMYYSCLLFCLKFKLEGFSNPGIRENLLELYNKELVSEVMHFLDDPEKIFDYYTLPRCGDCSCCPVQKECYYPQWKSLQMNVAARQKSNPIHQEKLAELFG